MELTTINDFKLPDGSVYTGECIKNNYMIELSGEGEIFYPNGDKFIGHFENGNVNGRGKYFFSDGDRHQGEFCNGIPNGIGYLNKQDLTFIGQFKNGKINGWALRIGKVFEFGWWKEGALIKDETDNVKWAFQKINYSSFDGDLVRIFKNGRFGMGIPQKNNESFIIPFFGFLLFADGCFTVGSHINHKKEGPVAVFDAQGSISYAEYKNDSIFRELTMSELHLVHLLGYPVD